MNKQIFSEHVNAPESVHTFDDGTEQPFFSTHPGVIEQTNVVGPVALTGIKDENIVQEAPMGQTIVYTDSVGDARPNDGPSDENPGMGATLLLGREEAELFRTRWNEIQGKFVDEPRAAVQLADALIAEMIEKITQMFTNERSALENEWSQGLDVSTEDLRKALQRYHTLFDHLVA